jgi:hypothetical protein
LNNRRNLKVEVMNLLIIEEMQSPTPIRPVREKRIRRAVSLLGSFCIEAATLYS